MFKRREKIEAIVQRYYMMSQGIWSQIYIVFRFVMIRIRVAYHQKLLDSKPNVKLYFKKCRFYVLKGYCYRASQLFYVETELIVIKFYGHYVCLGTAK